VTGVSERVNVFVAWKGLKQNLSLKISKLNSGATGRQIGLAEDQSGSCRTSTSHIFKT